MRMVAAISGGLTVQVDCLGLRVGGQPALSLHSSNEPGELSQWLCHDDSTINIIFGYYYYYYYGSLGPSELALIDRFSRFCRAYPYDQQKDRQRNGPRYVRHA